MDLELGSATVQITEKADGSYNLVITTPDNEVYFYPNITETSIGRHLITAFKDARGEISMF